MKNILILFLFLPSLLFSYSGNLSFNPPFTRSQAFLTGYTMSTSFWSSGVFNQNLNSSMSPAFEWPVNSGKFLGLSAGLCIGAYVNGQLRLANATYTGEFTPGYIINGSGTPIPKTSGSFHIYKVTKGDDERNPDFLNWSVMVPFGAPYDDVNLNEQFDYGIDIPGVKNSFQTIFVFISDGYQETHSVAEGFSGGTSPLFVHMSMTAWVYDYTGFENVQFIKYRMRNMSLQNWNKTYFSMFVNPQIGDSLDDYVGCDTLRRMGYAYNSDNSDGSGQGSTYGASPPAVGITLLKDSANIGMTSFHYVIPTQVETCPPCEEFPYSPLEAYNLMRGNKKDNTPWVNPLYSPPRQTKYCFSGDPETNTGWTEYNGIIGNCFGALNGEVTPNFSKARAFIMSTGSDNYTVSTGDIPVLYYAQLTARGSDNKNSVTKLKLLSDKTQQLYNNGFVLSVNQISSTIPEKFSLFQNYPNPFNPTTKIKFEIAKSDFVNLTVFDLSGKVVEQLVNEKLNEGIYEVNFSPRNISSGIYFYRLSTTGFTQTNRMILVK